MAETDDRIAGLASIARERAQECERLQDVIRAARQQVRLLYESANIHPRDMLALRDLLDNALEHSR